MKNKLNILIVHNYYQIKGGEDVVVNNEALMLKKRGHNVFFYERFNKEIVEYGMIKKIKLFLNTIFSIKTYKEIKNIIKKNNIDIVHVHNTLPLISSSVYWASKKMNVPVIQTLHNYRFVCPNAILFRNDNICEDCLNKNILQALKYKCYRNSFIATLSIIITLLLNSFIKSYDKVNAYILLTPFMKDKLHNFLDKKRVFIKPNFVPDEFINKINEHIDGVSIKKDQSYCVYAGRLDKSKGILMLIDMWENIKDLNLYIFGDGPETSTIKEKIKDKTNIKYFGAVSQEILFRYIHYSLAVIFPSKWYECFPMIIVESLALKKIVIIYDNKNINNIIKNGFNGFIFKNSLELRNILNFIKNNNEKYLKICENAYNEYINKYNENKNYDFLINIYYKLMEENNGKI
ncbi:glycosyltransferase family 4 protein [Caldicellulosiruptoraceae bacterium PP1]